MCPTPPPIPNPKETKKKKTLCSSGKETIQRESRRNYREKREEKIDFTIIPRLIFSFFFKLKGKLSIKFINFSSPSKSTHFWVDYKTGPKLPIKSRNRNTLPIFVSFSPKLLHSIGP
jgi:hypothetical protein